MKPLRTLGLVVFLGVIVWIGVGFTDLPDDTKRNIRAWIARALLGLLAVGLALAATASLPASTLLWASGGAAVAAAVAPSVVEAAGALAPGGGGTGDGGTTPVQCGDPGTCGEWINGALCLGSNC